MPETKHLTQNAAPVSSLVRSQTRILMIEDDYRLASMVRTYLQQAGFAVVVADNAASGIKQHNINRFDLVLLDLMLPDGDGLDICRRLRVQREVPIIMVTAKGDTTDRVVGLEIGADDYVTKPFEPRELLARIRAVLRRSAMSAGKNLDADEDDFSAETNAESTTRAHPTSGANTELRQVLRLGELEINPNARQVKVKTLAVELTGRQFDILHALARSAGRVLSRDQILDAAGAEPGESTDRAIDVHIAKIRAAIELDVKSPKCIITVRGAGYMLAKP
jgi:two-component system, OmpR family, response regulator RstA